MLVSGAADDGCPAHLQEGWALWKQRNHANWVLDLYFIEIAALTIVRLVPYKDRQRVGNQELDALLNADLQNQEAASAGVGVDPFDLQA